MNNGSQLEDPDDDVILIETKVPVIVIDDSIIMDEIPITEDNNEDGEINSSSESSSVELIDNSVINDNFVTEETIDTVESIAEDNVAHIDDPPEEITPDDIEDKKQIFSIVFNDKDIYDKWKTKITKLLQTKLDNIDVDESPDKFTLSVAEITKNGFFMFDTKPMRDENIPKYSKTISCVINGEDNNPVEDVDKIYRNSNNLCFNCDGNHTLRDCKEPKNFNKIRQARQMLNTKNERYHVDIEQRFGHFIPGVLSSNLRKALGLKRRQLPAHIYKMRVLGYPPGWLEEAKVKHSGISLFDSFGKKILESDEEEGEIDLRKDKYDIRKIHGFPGFNVDPEEDCYDDSAFYCVPPMLAEQSKEIMIQSLSGNTVQAYKKRKMKNLPTSSGSFSGMNESLDKTTMSTIDMDIDNNEDIPMMPPGVEVDLTAPPLPLSPVKSRKLPPPPESPPPDTPTKELENNVFDNQTNGNNNTEIRCDSPTLEDLNKKKRELLSTLGDSSAFLDTTEVNSSIDDSLIYDILELDQTNTSSTINDSNLSLNQTDTSDQNKSIIKEQTPKSTVFGTPILKQVSLYTKLPMGDLFSVGVSDVINFENLPSSTGKYKQMKTVLNKVRTMVQQINDEDL